MQHQRDDLQNRSISMAGLLGVLTSFALLLIYFKFSVLSRTWNTLQIRIYLAIAVLLGLWGIRQLLLGYLSQSESRGQKSRERRHFPRPGIVYLVIMTVLFIGAVIGRSNMLILVFALMAGPFVINGWATYSMLRRTDLQRELPRRTMAGEPVSVEISLENRKFFLSSWMMTVRDRIANRNEKLDASVLFARVPRRSRRHAQYQLRLMQRGRYELGPMLLSTRFPLGLVERGLVFETQDEILVYPRIGRLSPAWKQNHLTGAELSQRQSTRRGAYDDEFHRIREFRGGDNPRAIHWRTSARLNELMVCEYNQCRERNLILLLDLWHPRSAREIDLNRVELAVSLAATICAEHMRENRDSDVTLRVAGREYESWNALSGLDNLETLLESLATVESHFAPQSDQLFETARSMQSPQAQTLLITTRSRVDGSMQKLLAEEQSELGTNRTSTYQVIEARHQNLAGFFSLD